jgi:cupin fold WbuC family metalloprotein
MISAHAVNPEVLYADDRLVTVSRGQIGELVAAARSNPRARIRLCAHRAPGDALHDMLIVHGRSAYVRPHRHLDRAESFHVIDGRADLVLFDEGGTVSEVIALGDFASGLAFFYRMSDPTYHTLLIRSDVLVFHEATTGPFKPGGTSFAPWAPADGEAEAVSTFLAAVETHVRGKTGGAR